MELYLPRAVLQQDVVIYRVLKPVVEEDYVLVGKGLLNADLLNWVRALVRSFYRCVSLNMALGMTFMA